MIYYFIININLQEPAHFIYGPLKLK